MEDLKPCPFCGGPAFIDPPAFGTGWMAGCKNADCPAEVYGNTTDTRDQQIAAWNTRQSHPDTELVAALRETRKGFASIRDDRYLDSAQCRASGEITLIDAILSRHTGEGA